MKKTMILALAILQILFINNGSVLLAEDTSTNNNYDIMISTDEIEAETEEKEIEDNKKIESLDVQDTNVECDSITCYAWGSNSFGQLGIGNYDDVNYENKVNLSLRTTGHNDSIKNAIYSNGTIYALDKWGNIFTSGSNLNGQLGQNFDYSTNSLNFGIVKNPYVFSEFSVQEDTVIARILNREDYITWGKNTPDILFEPSVYVDTVPLTAKSNRPIYYKPNGTKIQNVKTFYGYNQDTIKTSINIIENQINQDDEIGHVNVYSINEKLDTEGAQKKDFYFDYSKNFLKVSAVTNFDEFNNKISFESNQYDAFGKLLKRFVPTFIAGSSTEATEWIELYKSDGTKETFYKEFGVLGCENPITAGSGTWDCKLVTTEKTSFSSNGKKQSYVQATYHYNILNSMNEEKITWYNDDGTMLKYGQNKYLDNGVRTEYIAISYVNNAPNRRYLERYDANKKVNYTAQTIYDANGIKIRYDETTYYNEKKQILTKTYYDPVTKMAVRKTIQEYSLNSSTEQMLTAQEWYFYNNGKKQSYAISEYELSGYRSKYIKYLYENTAKEDIYSRYQENFYSQSAQKSVTTQTDYKTGIKSRYLKEQFDTNGRKSTRYLCTYDQNGNELVCNYEKY